jgi:hypothetical protein
MNSTTQTLGRSLRAAIYLALALVAASAPTWAQDLNLDAQLIWATNGKKPADTELKDVDARLREKLAKVFKWRSYFEVTRKPCLVKAGKPGPWTQVRMSGKCRLEIQGQEHPWVEVKLYGEEKLVVKKRQAMKPGEILVLAGDDKDDTAWFVVLTTAEK